MKTRTKIFGLVAVTCAIPVLIGFAEPDQLDYPKLKTMISNLGYTVKDIGTEVGKEKAQIDVKTDAFNIPVGAEISPSKNYVWLTVHLGSNPTGDQFKALLRQNGSVQPSFFYLTKDDRLMLAHPIDNRSITPDVMKRVVDKVVKDVGNTSKDWQAKTE